MNSTKNSKTTRRRKKNNKKNKSEKGGSLFGGPAQFTEQRAPVATGTVMRNLTYLEMSKGIKHTEYGPGVRISGCQNLVTVTPNLTTGTALAGQTANAPGGNTVLMNPGGLNGRFAAIAVNFVRYAFRKIRFVYVTRSPTIQQGNFVMAYSSDSALNGATASFNPTNYLQVVEIVPSVVTPYWNSCVLEVEFTGTRTWYVSFDSGVISDEVEDFRQGIQGAFYAAIDGLQGFTQTTLCGEIFMEYVCDLYQPVPTLSSETLLLQTLNKYHVKKEFLSLLRQKYEPFLKDFAVLIKKYEEALKMKSELKLLEKTSNEEIHF